MPSKITTSKPPIPSSSRDVVPVGPRHVSVSKAKRQRDEDSEKPTTTRAMILRNGKHGARGTGEVMLVSKLSGREKLDLLAGAEEDLVEKSRKSFLNPFSLETCLKIANSQYNAFLDDIVSLQDSDLFSYVIEAEVTARRSLDPEKPDPLRNASHIASIVATKIHNAYMLASAWKLVFEALAGLAEEGLEDRTIKMQLKNNDTLKSRYLVLYDMVNILVNISQAKFSVLATTTPHYSRYFKQAEGSDLGEPEIIFDWAGLREACVSFLDSIIIELCFPRAPYPKSILYQVLHDAVDESPREAKRFPQALWDAVGDLSVSVELQRFLETPLLGPEGDSWKKLPRKMPEEYEHWVDAQLYSEKASELYTNYKDIVFPLENTRNKSVLENIWKHINLNYKIVSGGDIDTLWGLAGALTRTPQWHSFYMPDLSVNTDSDSDSLSNLALVKGKKPPKRLAITNGLADDSDDSMPALQSVSDSSDEDETDESDSDSDYSDDGDEDRGYDAEQEEISRMLREAMNTVHETDWLDTTSAPPEIDPFLQEDRKGNPFLTLLGSLRGRMFSSNPKLKTATRKEPLKASLGRAFQPSQPLQRPAWQPKSHEPTVEEVEDEDTKSHITKKKKKKAKKKKKLTSPDTPQTPPPPADVSQAPSKAPLTSTIKATIPASPPASPTKKVGTASKPPTSPRTLDLARPVPPQMSTTSLALSVETTSAQSARSYIQSENLDNQRTKVKSRPGHGTLFSDASSGKKEQGTLSKLRRGKNDDEDDEEVLKKDTRHSWFSKLTKKTNVYMHQLLNTAEKDALKPMKWERFLKIMRELGFEYDPSTAGSSVRFDPPDPRDKPITFHKPHPDPTLHPIMLKEFAKRLKKQYGWSTDGLLKYAAE